MARGTEEQKQTTEDVDADFPYRTLMRHPAWQVIRSALGDLEKNDDLELRTAQRYAIGYLIEKLIASGLIPPALAFTADTRSTVHPKYRWILELPKQFSMPSSTTPPGRKIASGQ